jgi:hypothetical protein
LTKIKNLPHGEKAAEWGEMDAEREKIFSQHVLE